MDSEDMLLTDKCEHLMNIVVESRKQFGKMCIDYEQKTSLVENKILNLQINTISNNRFKSKTVIPNIDYEGMIKDVEEFKNEIINNQERVNILKLKVTNTQQVVMQMKNDNIGKKLMKPLTIETMLADAKSKKKI